MSKDIYLSENVSYQVVGEHIHEGAWTPWSGGIHTHDTARRHLAQLVGRVDYRNLELVARVSFLVPAKLVISDTCQWQVNPPSRNKTHLSEDDQSDLNEARRNLERASEALDCAKEQLAVLP